MKWLLIGGLCIAAATIAVACGGGDDDKGRVALLSPAAYRDAIASSDAFVVNLHTPYEGEIEGTDAFIPFDDVASQAAKLPADKDAPLYIYCRSGRMSADATPDLQALGYTNIVDLKDGMQAWEAAGLDLVTRDRS